MKIRNLRFWILAADLCWMLVALDLGFRVQYSSVGESASVILDFKFYCLMILVAVVAWILLYFDMGLDGFKSGWHLSAILSQFIVAVSLLMLVLLTFSFLTGHYYSRLVLLYSAFFFFLGLVGLRCLARFLVTSKLRNIADYRCVILGHGPIAKELATKIASHPELPLRIVGFLFPSESEALNGFANLLEAPFTSVKTLQVIELLVKHKIQKLIIAMAQPNGAEIRKLIAGCRGASIQVYLVPQLYDLYLSNPKLEEIDGLPMLSLQDRNPPAIRFALKRAMDIVLSSAILLLISPILAMAVFVVHSRKGRAFRSELRCGKDGIPFGMYRLNVERHAGNPERYETLFVRWSLTELPQMWNVVHGDMSLVGPRPESPERVKHYSEWQRQRLKVHAGVTGLAQVHGLRDQHPSEEKARFDLQYIFNWSPLLDLSLILQTIWTLLFRGLSQEPVSSQPARSVCTSSDFTGTEALDANRT